jgi:MinD superfamily P-loop ATPase
MILSVASGKGGTGKTTIAINLALSLGDTKPIQFLDCDVEEPNAQFFLKPRINKIQSVFVKVPELDKERCTFCGKCSDICAFNALAVLKDDVLVFPELCHGCGGCTLLCPESALRETDWKIGVLEFGKSDKIDFIHGKLDIGQAMSPPVIRALKSHGDSSRTVIIDAPPGTSCPVVESVKGSDYSILVTEPTPFGFNDLQLAADTLSQLNIPFGVIINRADIGNSDVENYCDTHNIPVLMTIPMDRRIASAYAEGKPIIEIYPSYKIKFSDLYTKIKKIETSLNINEGKSAKTV